jgi:hypothetical protein
MIVVIFVLNFAISWFNAWGCGKTWVETRANGGLPHFLNWCGAIMSASGFTWCYLVLASLVGGTIPFEHTVNGATVHAPYLSAQQMQAFADLGYLVVILPILGSGLAITLHSWGVMWRTRTFGSTATSAWNTFAMGENIYSAVSAVPNATRGLNSFFSDDDEGGSIILLLVAVCVLGGVLTTRAILRSTMRSTAFSRSLSYEQH